MTRRSKLLTAMLLVCSLAAGGAAAQAQEWWMLSQTETGKACEPPIEEAGVKLTPDEMLKRFNVCKLLEQTPSLDLETVMINCEGDIKQVFIFSKSKETCEKLAKGE